MADAEILRAILENDAAADAALRDPHVRAALQKGSGFAMHGALRKFRRKPSSAAHRAAVGRALAHRRTFMAPLRKAPTMATVNGVGTRLYGRADWDSRDGTYIGTLYATFVFVPVLPLSSYLVSDAAATKGLLGSKPTWSFRAKVPLSDAHRIWQFAAAALVVAAVVIGVVASSRAAGQSKVHFINGLDVPVHVTLGACDVTVESQSLASATCEKGRRHLVATVGDRTVEELDVDVPGGTDGVWYSVLGAAPVYIEDVVYQSDRIPTPTQNPFYDRAGTSWFVDRTIQFAFVDAPKTISMRKGVASEMRRHAGVADGGWRVAAAYAARTGDPKRGAEIARRVAEAEPDLAEPAMWAVNALDASGDSAGAVAAAKRFVERDPQSIDAHRVYQTQMKRAGRLAEARAEYAAAFAKEPDSAHAGYLRARISPFADATPVYERLLAIHGDDVPLRRGLAFNLFQSRQFADAAKHYEKLASLDKSEGRAVLTVRARALAAVGRGNEARRIARDAITKGDWSTLIVYASLARLPGADASMPAPSTFGAQVAGADVPVESFRAELASWTHDTKEFEAHKDGIRDEKLLATCRLRVLAFTDVERAANLASEASDDTLGALDDHPLLALACELDRLGKTDLARKVHARISADARDDLPFEQIHALPSLDGVAEDLFLDFQAILEHAASRRVADPTRKAEMVARARRDDPLSFVVPR